MKKGKKGIKKTTKIMIVVAGAAVVCIGAIAVFGGSKNQETTPSVDVVTVKTGDVSQEVDASGTVESNEIKTYFSPVNAKIDKMDFETGDSVKKGEQLITYNVEDLEKEEKKEDLNLRSGELNYENTMNKSNKAANKQAAAAASVDELQAMVDSQEAYVYDLKQQLAEVQMQSQLDAQAQAEQAQADAQAQAQEAAKQAAAAYQEQMEKYNQELEKAQKAFDQAKEKELACLTAKKNAQLAYDQNQDPAKEQQLSNALVNATYDYEAAKVEKENAQDTLQEVKANVPSASDGTSGMEDLNGSTGDVSSVTVDTSDLELAIEQASSDLAELQSELATKEAEAEADTGSVTAEEEEQMKITNNLSEMDSKTAKELVKEGKEGIKAQFNGVVTDTKVVEGSSAAQGQEMFTVQNLDDVSVNVSVSKYDYDKLEKGQKAEITLGDYTYHGTVARISRVATPNEKGAATISVSVNIDDPDENIFIGVDAKAVIHAKEAKNVLTVPVEVVNIGKDGSFCYVVEGGVITKKNVTTGISSDSYVEIKDGLKKGDQVLTDIGDHEEGDQVTPVEKEENE